MVTTVGGKHVAACDKDLIDENIFKIAHPYQNLTSADKNKHAMQTKRTRASEARTKEVEIQKRARDEREGREKRTFFIWCPPSHVPLPAPS
jgi:hypothetical protein